MELQKALAGKRVGVSQSMSTDMDYVTGHSTVKDLEAMFQLAYLQFTDVTKDEKNYNNLINALEISLKNKDLDPDNVYSDSLNYILNNYSWRNKPYKVEDIQKLNYDRILEISKERTANAANYTFLFVGAFDEAVIRPLIEQYIASLPAKKGVKSNWINVAESPMGQTIKHFSHKMETPKTTVFISWFDTEMPYSLENSIKAQLLGKVLNRINRDKIREDAGAAYSISTYGYSSLEGDRSNTSISAYAPLKPEFTAANDGEHKDTMTLWFEADGAVMSGDFQINFDDLSFTGTPTSSERVHVSETLRFWPKGDRTTTWAFGNYSNSNIMYFDSFRVTQVTGSVYLKHADLNALPTPTFVPAAYELEFE